MHGLLWRSALVLALVVTLTDQAAQGQSSNLDDPYLLKEQDWPCHGRFRLAFSASAFWDGPVPGAGAAGSGPRPELRKLAERVMAPDIGAERAAAMIDTFAEGLPENGERSERLGLLFARVVEEANIYRRFILEGIVGMMGRHRLAADALARSAVAIDDLAGKKTPEAKSKRNEIEQRRFWEQRALDRANGEARLLCHRLTSLEGKLGRLSRDIAKHL